jgi:deoxyxylulose-5-phosphate synthase
MENDLLLIALSYTSQTAHKVRDLLLSKGISATLVFVKPLDLDHFSTLLSTHRYVATLEDHSLGTVFNNFLIQSGIREAEALHFGTPDMWVQFGSNTELKETDPLSIANRIFQEFFVDLRLDPVP